jgi:hypothetical protein
MILIPIQDVFAQTVNVTLANQVCQINIYQKQYTDSANPTSPNLITSLFCDLYINNTLIIGGVICQNLNKIVRDLYLGFIGDIVFFDTQGVNDPSSPGLGTRYVLLYLEAADLSGLG